MSIFTEMWTIIAEFSALISEVAAGEKYPTYFPLQKAMRTSGAWGLGLILVLGGGTLVHILYRRVPYAAKNLERFMMIVSYLLMAGIICVSVIREFVFKSLFPAGTNPNDLTGLSAPIYNFLSAYPLGWATTIPPILFMVLVWFACSYNVGTRSHLAFSEFRMKLPRNLQLACLTLDMLLWLAFAWVIIVGGLQVTLNNAANGSPVDDTNYLLMIWWFVILVPISFVLLSGRAIGVWMDDIARYRSGEQMVETFAIGGGE